MEGPSEEEPDTREEPEEPEEPEAPGRGSPRFTVKGLLIGLAAAFVVGVAAVLMVRNVQALGVEVGGTCTGRRRDALGSCPRGSTWMMVVSLGGLLVGVPAAFIALLVTLRTRFALPLLAVAVAAGVLPGDRIFDGVHGPTLETAWTVRGDSQTPAHGVWRHGSTVIRALPERLVAHDLATGDRRWTYDLPASQRLCAMSADTVGGLGVVGVAAQGSACSRFAIVDLAKGEAREVALPGRPPDASVTTLQDVPSGVTADMVAVAGGVLVVGTRSALYGYRLRDGRGLWRRPAAPECRFGGVRGGGDRVLVEVGCGVASYRVRAVDATTGLPRWETPVPDQGPTMGLTLLSASPAVVHVRRDRPGVDTGAIATFDDAGRIRATIPVDDGRRRLRTHDVAFDAAPDRALKVDGDRLVVQALTDGRRHGNVQVYGLGDGRLRWSTRLDDVLAVRPEPGRVLVVAGGLRAPRLHALATADGAKSYLGVTTFLRWPAQGILLAQGDGYVVLTRGSPFAAARFA